MSRPTSSPLATSLRWAVIASLVTVLLVMADVQQTGRHVLNLVQPGQQGPSIEVIEHDFPGIVVPTGTGHDGQQMYAIARSPMHLDEVAPHLDRAHYRLQRPLLPWLAWMLHPFGGGTGLVLALFVVGLASLVGGGVATGLLAHRLGADARMAALFPLLPGSYVALRISAADHLALALVVAALAFAAHERWRWATASGVLAALAKEPMLVVLAGTLLWRRDRRTLTLVGLPTVIAALWGALVRLLVRVDSEQVIEFTFPFSGWVDSAPAWAEGRQLWAGGAVLLTVVAVGAGVLAWQRAGRPAADVLLALGPALAWLAMMVVLSDDAIGLDLNGTRIAAPALLLGAVATVALRSSTTDGTGGAEPGQRVRRWSRQPNRSMSGAGTSSTSE